MANSKNKSPRWPKDSTDAVENFTKDFEKNLRRIAVRLALHSTPSNVDPVHVSQAFEILSQAGLKRRPFLERPDVETGFGGLLTGAAPAVPHFFQLVMPEATFLEWKVTYYGMAIAFIVGAILMVHGWYRGTV